MGVMSVYVWLKMDHGLLWVGFRCPEVVYMTYIWHSLQFQVRCQVDWANSYTPTVKMRFPLNHIHHFSSYRKKKKTPFPHSLLWDVFPYSLELRVASQQRHSGALRIVSTVRPVIWKLIAKSLAKGGLRMFSNLMFLCCQKKMKGLSELMKN